MAQNVPRLASLNGIRGFAVLLVLLSHASNDGVLLAQGINFSGAGHYGVFLFFVLSSFLLTRQFLVTDEKIILSTAVLQHYFLRRFLRIYPLFFAALIVYYLLNRIGLFIVPVSGTMIVKSLLLLDAEGLFWTVPVEFQFYFILPFVACLLTAQQRPALKIVTVALCCGCWTYFFPPKYSVTLLPFLPVFVLGSLAADGFVFLEKRPELFTRNMHRFCNIAALVMMFSFMLLAPKFLVSLVPFSGARAALQYQFLFFGLLSCGLVLCTLCSNGVVRRMMESRFLVFWGKLSFSAYLGHKIILAFVTELVFLPSIIQFVLFFTLTGLLSYCSYQYFERPLAKIANVQ